MHLGGVAVAECEPADRGDDVLSALADAGGGVFGAEGVDVALANLVGDGMLRSGGRWVGDCGASWRSCVGILIRGCGKSLNGYCRRGLEAKRSEKGSVSQHVHVMGRLSKITYVAVGLRMRWMGRWR